MRAIRELMAADGHFRLIIGMTGLTLANSLGLNTVPLINGQWQEELGLTSTQVGTLLTMQILSGAIIGIALSTQLHRILPRRLGLVSGAIVVLANLELAFAKSYPSLVVGCLVSGGAAGCLTACSAAAVAVARQVDRTSALVAIGSTVIVALLTVLIVRLISWGGREALFLGQAAILVGAWLLTAALTERHPDAKVDQSLPMPAALRSPVVLSSICLSVGSTGVWAFTERIGVRLGLGTTLIGDMIAATAVFALVGGVCAAGVARPRREKLWAIVGVLTFGVTTSLLGMAWNEPVFLIALGAQAFTYTFAMPFVTAVAVTQDRSGGLAAAMAGWSTLLSAGAPALAGILVRDGSYINLAWLALGGTVVSVAALVPVRIPEAAQG